MFPPNFFLLINDIILHVIFRFPMEITLVLCFVIGLSFFYQCEFISYFDDKSVICILIVCGMSASVCGYTIYADIAIAISKAYICLGP